MLVMKAGSMGEMPPSTRVSAGRSALIASPAKRTIAPNRRQSGSISKSQCERLLGSFQSMAASTMLVGPRGVGGLGLGQPGLVFANEDLWLRVSRDGEAGAADHGLEAGAVGDPPVRRIARVQRLDKEHLGV